MRYAFLLSVVALLAGCDDTTPVEDDKGKESTDTESTDKESTDKDSLDVGGGSETESGISIKGFGVSLSPATSAEMGELRIEFSLRNSGDDALAGCGEGTLTAGDFEVAVHADGHDGTFCAHAPEDEGVCIDKVNVTCEACTNKFGLDLCHLPAGATAVVKMTQHLHHEVPNDEGTSFDLELKLFAHDGDPVVLKASADL